VDESLTLGQQAPKRRHVAALDHDGDADVGRSPTFGGHINQRDDIVSEPRTVNGKTISNFHVAGGVCVVNDGKIVESTDYFFL
jgi:hypothetical protein